MKFNVTFRSTLRVDFNKHPAGEELAEFLASGLRERGSEILLADNYEDFAWLLEFKDRSSSPWILVGHIDDGVFEWLAQINSGVNWFGRLFGRSDDESRQLVAQKLHAVLSSDSRFSEIRWHEGEFSDEGWSPSPA